MSLAAMMRRTATSGVAALVLIAVAGGASAQTTASPPVGSQAPTADNAILLTIFLKHDQSRPLGELDAQLAKQGFYKAFPPPGIEVVSWYVAMGVGQVVTLRLPASQAARGQSRPGRHRLGRLSHRVLSGLRLQIDRHGNAREGPIARGDRTVLRLKPAGTIQS